MRKKAISIMLALVIALALLPTIPVSAAGANPWTGKWIDNNNHTWSFWQSGDKVVGTIRLGGSFIIEGTLSGNSLKGTYTIGSRTYEMNLTISADGQTISTGEKDGYFSDTEYIKKVIDYSEITLNYNPGTSVLWTGLWNIDEPTWGAIMFVQDGDKINGYVYSANDLFEGNVSGGVATVKVTQSDNRTDTWYRFTMSADGKSCKAEYTHNTSGSQWSTPKDAVRLSPITYELATLTASDWAKTELRKAEDYGLIPDSLKSVDLTKPITRQEFAAVSVKLYENLSGKKAVVAAKNPFTDTNDAEVLKAVNIGITAGTAADKFSPDVLINREQMAIMLLRALKAAYIPGWTLPGDGNFILNFTQPAKFADDDKISDWAKPSVYYATANGIIAGTGNNMFSPRATTPAEEAIGYASATKEQALVIAVRMVDNLKGKPLDYTESQVNQPAPPSSASLTLEKIKQTATSMDYDILDGYHFDNDSGASQPVDGAYICTTIGNESVTSVSVIEFATAADAQKHVDYFNKTKAQYPTVYAKYSAFSYEKFYFTIEDTSNNAGKDVLTLLIPNWESLMK